MFDLFTAMMKEEWRVHTSLFGTSGFVLFPLLIMSLASAGALIWPLFSDVMPIHLVVVLTHYSFVIVGASVGAFGLFGREVMNRRFGQASMIAYSSRSLPLTEKNILFHFFVKDTIYYLFFWITPFVAGIGLVSPLIGVSIMNILLLLLTLMLSFLIGLSGVFLLSTIYVHSSRLLLFSLGSLGSVVLLGQIMGRTVVGFLPSLVFFTSRSPVSLVEALLLIFIPTILSLTWMKVDYREKTSRFPQALDSLMEQYRWSTYAPFIAKDTLDLTRSEGGAGKIVFSFLVPVGFLWIALFVLQRFIPQINPLIVFAILLGVISSTIYNWVTEFDLFTSYSFLPVKVSTVIRAKLQSYSLLNLVSLAILLGIGIGMGEIPLLFPAILTFVSVSLYSVAVTVYYTGLSPTVMLYNVRVYVPYLALIAPLLLFLIFVSIPNPWFVLTSMVSIPFGWYLLKRGFTRYDSISQQSF